MVDLLTDEEAVLKSIDDMDNNFSSGPDGVPATVLKTCKRSLAKVISFMYNLSLKSGIFPSLWKTAYIVPIHKKGDRASISNYRPISKLSAIPKLFESILLKPLNFHCKQLISVAQHGFVPSRSTVTNLVSFTSECLNAFEDRKQVDCIFTDFSKAFDRISHELLILKLKLLGFPDGFILWVQSYLCNRIQRVVFRSTYSKDIEITSGVPQGSHLGPFLFIVFINDVVNVIKFSKVLIFADDVKLFKTISNSSDCLNLQNDLSSFYTWCKYNCMSLNVDKCKFVSFSRKINVESLHYHINGIILEKLDGAKDLGVFLDSALNFHKHMDVSVSKANAMLGFVRRWTKDFNDPYVLKTLYVSLVRSVLEYGVQVWCPYYIVHIDRIEQVQKRFIRYALRALPWKNNTNLPDYKSRLKLLSIDSLFVRRSVCQVAFIYKLLSGDVDAPELLMNVGINAPSRSLRSSSYSFLHIGHHRTNYGFHEPLSYMANEFNSCYREIDFGVDVRALKNQLYSSSIY